MGWVALGGIAVAVAAALVLLRLPRRLWVVAGVALALGAAGYAVQGRPGLGPAAADPTENRYGAPPLVSQLRDMLFGRITSATQYQLAADALLRVGDPKSAAAAVIAGLKRQPNNIALWTELGTVLAVHDGTVSPPALYAFEQAMRIAPQHPGPPFFLGLAYIDSRDLAKARASWAQALALSPAGTPHHDVIAAQLAQLDQLIAMVEAARRANR